MTGIPLMASIQAFALRREVVVNGFVIRKERKETGRRRQIEGSVNEQPIVFVDDIINGGNSVIRAEVALSNINRCISQVVALIDFETSRIGERLLQNGINLKSLISLEELGLSKSARLPQSAKDEPMFYVRWKLDQGDVKSVDVVPKCTPAFDGDSVYHGTDSGMFYACDARTGEVRWKFAAGTDRHKGIRSSPLIHENLVYFGAYDGVFYALERSSGRLQWEFVEADWIGSSPCCAPTLGRVFVGLEHAMPGRRGSLVALDSQTGERCWQVLLAGLVHCSPCFIPSLGSVVIGSNDGEIYCVDAATGLVRWGASSGGAIKARPCYDEKSGLVIVGSFDRNLYALRADTGEIVWRFATQGVIYSEPLISQDDVYISSTDKHLYRLNIADGREVYRYFAGAKLFTAPSEWHSKVYFASTAGNIFELDPKNSILTGSHVMPAAITNKVVWDEANRCCYIATVDGQLYACERR